MGEVESFAVELVEPAFVDDEVVLELPSGEDVAAALEVVWFDDPGEVFVGEVVPAALAVEQLGERGLSLVKGFELNGV